MLRGLRKRFKNYKWCQVCRNLQGENLAVEAPSPSEDSLQQMDFLKPLCASTPAGGPGPGTMFTTSSDSERFEKPEPSPDIPCISNKASVTNSKLGATLSHSTTSIASSTAKIFFSLLLFWLLLAAVAIALFEVKFFLSPFSIWLLVQITVTLDKRAS